jgi:hypothetical protein
VDPRAIVWREKLNQLKNPMTSSGIKTATSRLAAQCRKQLPYHVLLRIKYISNFEYYFKGTK